MSKNWRTLLSCEALSASLGDPDVVVVDCRFELGDPEAGERAYLGGHIRGAVYAHLERDLSDLGKPKSGRHPLPEAAQLCARLGRWGIDKNSAVVVYDAADGAYAARLWWLLRTLGHEQVALLDGGLSAWTAAGGALEKSVPRPDAKTYTARYNVRRLASIAVLAARMASQNGTLIDARAPERFRGEIEPIDRVAGHIPGASNRHYARNLNSTGRFKSAEVLRIEFDQVLESHQPSDAVHMCGSGVSACHNLLAMEHAGLEGSRLYVGSWSEWISDPARPIARGA